MSGMQANIWRCGDMSEVMRIIFILSLPRSGSTLLQKVLMTNAGAATISESWLLPPLYYMDKPGAYAEYAHWGARLAHDDLLECVGRENFSSKRADFIRSVFQLCAGNDASSFIEKTPRNALFCREILQDFPEEMFIVLWRNPLDIVSSIISTWGKGRWNLYAFKLDLYKCLENLVDLAIRYPDKLCVVHYEDLVSNPQEVMQDLCGRIGGNIVPDVKKMAIPRLSGFMGDKKGDEKEDGISDNSIGAWKKTLCNPVRVYWAKKYLNWIGKERLKIMGYDIHQLCEELDNQPMSGRYMLSDVLAMLFGLVYVIVDFRIIHEKLKNPWRHVVNNG